MDLTLGTVRFGLIYGIANNRREMSDAEIREILGVAYLAGIRVLDTAPDYGRIEEKLSELCGQNAFRVTSKVPAIPAELSPEEAAAWAIACAERSRMRLQGRLATLLFHRAEDLLGSRGEVVWQSASEWSREHGIQLGVSAYDAPLVRSLVRSLGVAVVQLPGNAFDQAVADLEDLDLEVQVRSAFLQGLLLLPANQAIKRLELGRDAISAWHAWLASRGLDAAVGALSIVKGLAGARSCVVGVESATQLRELLEAWGHAVAISAPELKQADRRVTDPRAWVAQSAVASKGRD